MDFPMQMILELSNISVQNFVGRVRPWVSWVSRYRTIVSF